MLKKIGEKRQEPRIPLEIKGVIKRPSFSESKTALLLTVNREYTSMHADIYTNEQYLASVKIGKKGQIKIPKRSDVARNLMNSTASQNDIQLFLKDF